MSTVLAFKMVSGEEVIAEVLDTTSILTGEPTKPSSYSVKRPHTLQIQPMGNGQLGLAFVPWLLCNPAIDNIEIPASAVLTTFSPADRVERQYLEQTSGITIASAGSRISV